MEGLSTLQQFLQQEIDKLEEGESSAAARARALQDFAKQDMLKARKAMMIFEAEYSLRT